MRSFLVTLLLALSSLYAQGQCWQFVDPRIGSVGVGRTFPGPSMPFGMVKPGPDCGDGLSSNHPNAGWAPMPMPVLGFSQTHVSGTGGGQKYGNILIQPFVLSTENTEDTEGKAGQSRLSVFSVSSVDHLKPQRRTEETIELGYYATTYENGIRTEITTGERCAHYRFHYPAAFGAALLVDATHFLGKDSVPNLRERQQFVAADVRVVSNREVEGYSTVRGGWNNGDAYTVYFCLRSDKSFSAQSPILSFSDTLVNVAVGISYVSTEQARRNLDGLSFDDCLSRLRQTWEEQLAKVQITGTEAQRRMFYTALYHTMLMPVDKTGENPRWADAPYYDDYYAIWDTYRTSSPLLTLLCPQRQTDMVRALLNIYCNEGYLPDARSGDCNGRTQGGSNAEVVIADAFAKGLGSDKKIDYRLALEAMLKDGEADPGEEHEKHGRGGLTDYKRLGYIPYGVPRAGTRTVEYAFNDWCIAQVAQGLGFDSISEVYSKRSQNWRNLWRQDYEWDGMRGFIMPRDADGRWLDSVPWGRSQVFHPRIPYTPVTKVAPWYLPWWDTFFYEATSEEYSLSVPHDVDGLIEACGGSEAFRQRLDRFFERGYYNVQNEPSFLTPCLYHWLGRPDLSTQRIHQIVRDNYSDAPDGLPGNDDSGAMSSWLAFHMMGLYPLAGSEVYLLNVPLLPDYTFTLSNGRTLHVSRQGEGGAYGRALLNGRELASARITHQELMEGGELVYETKNRESEGLVGSVLFVLNRQFRTWPLSFRWEGDTLTVVCMETAYRIPRAEAEHATGFCWLTPQQDGTIYNNVRGTFLFVSADAMRQLRECGFFVYDGITWRREGDASAGPDHVRADVDGTELFIEYHRPSGLYLVTEMCGNPLGIDWKLRLR